MTKYPTYPYTNENQPDENGMRTEKLKNIREEKVRLFIGIPLTMFFNFSKPQRLLASTLNSALVLYESQLILEKQPHLTLAFIGETAFKNVTTIDKTIHKLIKKRAEDHSAPFELTINNGISIYGVNALAFDVHLSPAFHLFVDLVKKKLIHEGIEIHRTPFKPHCTIGRIPRGVMHHEPTFCDQFVPELSQIAAPAAYHSSGSVQPTTLVLYESHNHRYTPLVTWQL